MPRKDEPPPPEFSAEDLAQLRKELRITQKDLAIKLGIETALVAEWESGEAFPTLASARKLLALREGQPLETRARRVQADPLKGLLADPEFWTIVRKLLGSRELYAEVRRLARTYPDPANPQASPPKEGSP